MRHLLNAEGVGWRTTRLAYLAIGTIGLFLLMGCASKGAVTGNPRTLISDKYYEELSKEYFENDGLKKKQKIFDDLLLKKDLVSAKDLRNSVSTDLMSISDYLYAEVRNGLYIGRAMSDSYAQIVVLLLTSLATVSKVEDTKTALSAAAAYMTGTKAILDKEFFAEKTKALIINTMDGERAQIKATLINNFGKGATEFNFSQAVSSVQEYHRAGSLVSALVKLELTASSTAAAQINELKNVEKVKATTK